MKYFRIDATTYEQTRLHLDAVFGHPTPDGRTMTCVPPLASAPKDASGRVLLSVWPEFVEIAAVAAALPALLASGAVEELTEAEFLASHPAE